MSLASLFDTHLAILPVLLPAATAMLLLLQGDAAGDTSGSHGHHKQKWARRIAIASVTLGLLLAARLAIEAHAGPGALRVYRVGDWPAPFGIVLVVDRLSALMLLLTACVALPVLVYASGGWDAHGRHFHALFQFQLMGLNGAFVTGDWGYSFSDGRPVLDRVVERLPASAELLAASFVLAVAAALPAGLVAAVRKGALVDQALPPQFTGNLLHSLDLGSGSDSADGKTDVNGWSNTFIEQLSFQENLTISN